MDRRGHTSSGMIPFSILDLCPIAEGSTVGKALAQSLDLARHAEALGYNRFWLAEHHNIPGIASAATAVVIAHVAAGTQRIRLGAGGVMLPNHAPLVIAEQFGTLAALHPGRIDLGLGRAPGGDMATARALRRTLVGGEDRFPQDVLELQSYLADANPEAAVRAVPGQGTGVPLWILGSSTYGAQLAAMLGLPYAFASHFAPAALFEALEIYRETFRPSAQLEKPYAMVAANVIAAPTDDEADLLATSVMQSFLNLRRGRPGLLPPPDPGLPARLTGQERAMLDQIFACSAVGGPERVRAGLARIIDATGADELILAANVHDHELRKRSFAIAMGERERVAA
jgi:luciferase family oxidoreductase group 1